MKLKTKLTALAVASALMGSTAASATPLPVSLTNLDGTFTDWVGIDWNAVGNAVVSGFVPVTGNNFTLSFWATATSLSAIPGGLIPEGGLDKGEGDTGTYEYTIFGTLSETATCANPSSCSFTINSGSFAVYYDISPDAVTSTGAGILDGDVLFSGVLPTQPGGSFTGVTFTDGFGISVAVAGINYTNPAYITPDLAWGNTITTLQIGTLYNTNGWTPPTGMPTGAIPQGAILLQADMNSSIQSVPEPASIALLGLGLLGLGAMRRRKS